MWWHVSFTSILHWHFLFISLFIFLRFFYSISFQINVRHFIVNERAHLRAIYTIRCMRHTTIDNLFNHTVTYSNLQSRQDSDLPQWTQKRNQMYDSSIGVCACQQRSLCVCVLAFLFRFLFLFINFLGTFARPFLYLFD